MNPHGHLAYDEVERVLGPWLCEGGLRVSPLGPTFSRDVDSYLKTPAPREAMIDAGWLSLDGLLAQVGVREQGRWAVVVQYRVVGAADLHLEDPPDPVEHILERCRRRGFGPRERAELKALEVQGHCIPPIPQMSGTRRVRARLGRARRGFRPKLVVAVSGVDGAGKSTLVASVVESLRLAGVPATGIWVRPGVTSRAVEHVARTVKRSFGVRPEPGVRRVAMGDATLVASRNGALGVAWTILVLLNFGWIARRKYLSARGVTIFDRHTLDALVTWEVLYSKRGGRAAAWLIHRTLPEAEVTVYLDVPASLAVGRKPGDPIGMWAVRQQLEAYRPRLAGVNKFDGRKDPEDLAYEVLTLLAGEWA